MAKRKLDSCLISTLSFWLCFVVLVVAGTDVGSTDESTGADQNSNEAGGSASQLSLVMERLETLEKKHQKLEKSHAEINRRFKSLTKEVEELRNENCVGEDVWLLTPPLRGRRGQKGEKGDSGLVAQKKHRGKPVQIGSPVQLSSQSSTTPKADSGTSDSTFIAAPTTEEPTTGFPGGSQNKVTETSTARPTTLTSTEKVRIRPVGAAAAAATVMECNGYSSCRSATEPQHYDATRDGNCKTYSYWIKSVQLTGSCVTLYRKSDCSGNQFQLNTENSEKGRDVRNLFPYQAYGQTNYIGPISIGPCSQWINA